MDIEGKQREIAADFADFEDPFDRYAYLVELAQALPPMDSSLKTEEHVVKGCQSKTWLAPHAKNGVFSFQGDSDTFIVKGVLFLLQHALCGQPAAKVASCSIHFMQDAGISEMFDDSRRSGIAHIVETLQTYARSHCG